MASPSSLYRAWSWRLGLVLTRLLPLAVLRQMFLLAGEAYCRLNRQRTEVVLQNLLPALGGDRTLALRTTRRLYRQFALKLLDLWRFENGLPVRAEPADEAAFQSLTNAGKRGRGVLLVTPHLGNWEIGGPLMDRFGIRLLVLTQAEPGQGFTELRRESRSRRGIETLVVGTDAFAFVEVIKRLQEGAAVALLIDRPPPPSAVTVQLFGRPFRASIAAAELARASGCALLGVTLIRKNNGYEGKILPEFEYDRKALGTREGRCQLTQRIVRAFEPEIQQHLDQWFHFVPVWPDADPSTDS